MAPTAKQKAAKARRPEARKAHKAVAKTQQRAAPSRAGKKADAVSEKRLQKSPPLKRRNPLTRAEIEDIFERFAAKSPEPKGELEHSNVFTLLVAVVLSAQATDAGVNKATRPLFRVADTPEKMLALGEDKVREYIKTIGLYRNKAKNVIALCRRLIEDFGSEVPEDRDILEQLPGVGRKTANVVMNVAFGHPTMAVDTHVFRVSNRIGLSKGKTPLAVEKDLLKKVPERFGVHAHHWLILHGRYICKARKPECAHCIIRDICRFKDKTV